MFPKLTKAINLGSCKTYIHTFSNYFQRNFSDENQTEKRAGKFPKTIDIYNRINNNNKITTIIKSNTLQQTIPPVAAASSLVVVKLAPAEIHLLFTTQVIGPIRSNTT